MGHRKWILSCWLRSFRKIDQIEQRVIRKIKVHSNICARRLSSFFLNLFSRQLLNASFNHGYTLQFYDQKVKNQVIIVSSRTPRSTDIGMGYGEKGHWINGSQKLLNPTEQTIEGKAFSKPAFVELIKVSSNLLENLGLCAKTEIRNIFQSNITCVFTKDFIG